MATVSAKSTTFRRAIATSRCLFRFENSKRWSPETSCSLPTSGLRIRSLSWLRASNSSDNPIEFGQDYRSEDAVPIIVSCNQGRGSRSSVFDATRIPFTLDAKRALELSSLEALRLGCNSIGSEHLLLGLLRSGQSEAGQVLKNLGGDYQAFRQGVIQMYDDEGNKVNVATGESNGSTKMPTKLEEYGTDLTKLAEEGKLDVLDGRQAEIERVVQILCRGTNNNPCLIGEAPIGIGLAQLIAKGLAQRIASGDVPDTIKGKKVIKLDMLHIYNIKKILGRELEEILKEVRDGIKPSDEIILFIDDLHTIVNEVGAAEGAIDAANFMKPVLASDEMRCIVATTVDEYKRHIEKDPALERRFVPVKVTEPSTGEMIPVVKDSLQHAFKEGRELLEQYWQMMKSTAKVIQRKKKREKAEKVARDLVIAINEMNEEEINETNKEEFKELNKVMFVREEGGTQVVQVIFSSGSD